MMSNWTFPTDEEYAAMLTRLLQTPDSNGIKYSPEVAELMAMDIVIASESMSQQIARQMQNAARASSWIRTKDGVPVTPYRYMRIVAIVNEEIVNDVDVRVNVNPSNEEIKDAIERRRKHILENQEVAKEEIILATYIWPEINYPDEPWAYHIQEVPSE